MSDRWSAPLAAASGAAGAAARRKSRAIDERAQNLDEKQFQWQKLMNILGLATDVGKYVFDRGRIGFEPGEEKTEKVQVGTEIIPAGRPKKETATVPEQFAPIEGSPVSGRQYYQPEREIEVRGKQPMKEKPVYERQGTGEYRKKLKWIPKREDDLETYRQQMMLLGQQPITPYQREQLKLQAQGLGPLGGDPDQARERRAKLLKDAQETITMWGNAGNPQIDPEGYILEHEGLWGKDGQLEPLLRKQLDLLGYGPDEIAFAVDFFSNPVQEPPEDDNETGERVTDRIADWATKTAEQIYFLLHGTEQQQNEKAIKKYVEKMERQAPRELPKIRESIMNTTEYPDYIEGSTEQLAFEKIKKLLTITANPQVPPMSNQEQAFIYDMYKQIDDKKTTMPRTADNIKRLEWLETMLQNYKDMAGLIIPPGTSGSAY